MLYLISMGLAEGRDMSLRALEAAGRCDKLYAEFYTTGMHTDVQKLSKLIGKNVQGIRRFDLENNSEKIVSEAKSSDIGILVGGDALTATTHISLLQEAIEMKIKYKVIHGSSIYTAVAETGLQLYNFGKTVSLPFPQKNYKPEGFLETIETNKRSGLHTLFLLDIKEEEKKYMDAPAGAELLIELFKRRKSKIVSEATKAVAACMLGAAKQSIVCSSLKGISENKGLRGKTPAVLIVPGKLHFMEEEFLAHFRK
ncbi:MAG: diphthine synthase [Candidatus Aenigmarchaeota archaeon]|nr:diphthine synthase [Candidatus Aenigmarchaeota archaeon]